MAKEKAVQEIAAESIGATKTGGLNNREWVATQYKTPANLNARIQLHKRFSTNPEPWLTWVYRHMQVQPGMRILEIGGGPGGLWDENRQKLPADVRLFFTDQSLGMLAQARATLSGLHQIRFAAVDAQAIPFANGVFDIVVANHMLYHVPNRRQALAEIRRVLAADGRFFAATNDHSHMREMRELAEEYRPGSAELAAQNARFPFDVATRELSEHFGQVQLHRYDNRLIIDDAGALAAYMLSGISFGDLSTAGTTVAEQPLRQWLAQRIEEQGAITVTNAAGLFEAATAVPG